MIRTKRSRKEAMFRREDLGGEKSAAKLQNLGLHIQESPFSSLLPPSLCFSAIVQCYISCSCGRHDGFPKPTRVEMGAKIKRFWTESKKCTESTVDT